MSWPLAYLIAVSLLIVDALFAILTGRHVHAVHDREAAFRPRDDQSNDVSEFPHGERFK